jgi:hypothetical protein
MIRHDIFIYLLSSSYLFGNLWPAVTRRAFIVAISFIFPLKIWFLGVLPLVSLRFSFVLTISVPAGRNVRTGSYLQCSLYRRLRHVIRYGSVDSSFAERRQVPCSFW